MGDRYFWDAAASATRIVGEGTEPEDIGIDPAELIEIERPPQIHEYVDEATREIVCDMDRLRALKWAEVKAERDRLEDGHAPTPFGPAQADDRSKVKISGLVQMAQIALGRVKAQAAAEERSPTEEEIEGCFAEAFTMADNNVVTLSAEMAVALGVAVAAYVSAIHAASRALRARIEDPEAEAADIEAIDVAAEFAAMLAPGETEEENA